MLFGFSFLPRLSVKNFPLWRLTSFFYVWLFYGSGKTHNWCYGWSTEAGKLSISRPFMEYPEKLARLACGSRLSRSLARFSKQGLKCPCADNKYRTSRRGYPVVSPTVCSPTNRVDSPTSYMSVRLRVRCWSFKSELWKVLAPCIIPSILSSMLRKTTRKNI